MLMGGSLLLAASKTFSINIGASVNNFVLATALTAAGWNGTSPVRAVVTVGAGVTVGSTSTGSAAFVVGTFPAGSSISLVNNGTISGAGGAGGAGTSGGGNIGLPGGNALQISFTTKITNNGTVAGGGGAGGGGLSGGGGGAGTVFGLGGSSYGGASPGVNGTATAGGAGGVTSGGHGGNGGNLGGPGTASSTGTTGGTAGNYIVGNVYATWVANGTRLGGFV